MCLIRGHQVVMIINVMGPPPLICGSLEWPVVNGLVCGEGDPLFVLEHMWEMLLESWEKPVHYTFVCYMPVSIEISEHVVPVLDSHSRMLCITGPSWLLLYYKLGGTIKTFT